MAVTNTKASATLVTARIYYSSLVVLDSEHFSVADEILAIFASFFGGNNPGKKCSVCVFPQ